MRPHVCKGARRYLCRTDQLAVISAVIVEIDDQIEPLRLCIIGSLLDLREVGGVECAVQRRLQTFPGYGEADRVHPLGGKILQLRMGREIIDSGLLTGRSNILGSVDVDANAERVCRWGYHIGEVKIRGRQIAGDDALQCEAGRGVEAQNRVGAALDQMGLDLREA
jgi:hypothetical protein